MMRPTLILTGLLALGVLGGASMQSSVTRKSPWQADQADPTKIPTVYVVPLRGQLGTDIHSSIYGEIVKDVKAKKPDLILFTLESADIDRNDYLQNDNQEEASLSNFEDARILMRYLKEDLKDFPQAMWVKDSVGFGSIIAMGWPDMFMAPDARLWGLGRVMMLARHPDYEVTRKFLAAVTGIAGGFLEYGGYDSKVLGEAMMRPERRLSVSWEGRELKWRADDKGQYVIDNDEKAVANFNAKTAEDFLISDGTAEDIDEVMFLLGYREWNDSLVKEKKGGTRIIDDYIKKWRAAFDNCETWLKDARREQEWASGDDALAHLGKAKKAYENILDAFETYPAVETRWGRRGVRKADIELQIKTLKERITAMQKAKQNRSGSGSGPGGGVRGAGGGAR